MVGTRSKVWGSEQAMEGGNFKITKSVQIFPNYCPMDPLGTLQDWGSSEVQEVDCGWVPTSD